MKTALTLLLALLITNFVFSQNDTIAIWSFPTGGMSDTLPEQASALNLLKSIFTDGGTGNISMKNGATTKAAQTSGWDNGENLKSWQLEINTTGFEGIKVSSKQTAGATNAGPRDFKLQYKIGLGTWTDVTGGNIIVANDWSTGFLDNADLPSECNNQASLSLRWVMTTNLDINGDTILSSGAAKIDDILISGSVSTGINESITNNFKFYPNPCRDFLKIESTNEIERLSIYTIDGRIVKEIERSMTNCLIDTKGLDQGTYIIVVDFENQRGSIIEYFVLK